jgi:hypothetical protein
MSNYELARLNIALIKEPLESPAATRAIRVWRRVPRHLTGFF